MNYLVFVIISLSVIGCAGDDTTTAMNPVVDNITVSPSDNQSDVSTSSAISLTFVKAVDQNVVEKNFRLMNQRSYVDSLCPVSSTMNHGQMSISMMDSMKMNHLDSIHSIKGTFYWNSDGKSCSFKPDSSLQPGMQHMVHLREGMITMMESTMGSMGMMGRNGMGSGMGRAIHFTTKTSGSSGGGHDSHHP